MDNLNMVRKHYDWVDALRGIAIFLVVLGHSIIEYPINLHENPILQWLFLRLSVVHMPLFFVVSGFCFSFQGNYLQYLKKKVRRLLIPYLFFSILDAVPRFFFPFWVNRSKSIGDSILAILLYGGEYWFLYSLFLIMLIYPLIYAISSRKRLYLIISVVLFYLLNRFFPSSVQLLTASSIAQYIVFFAIGVLLNRLMNKIDFSKLNHGVAFILFVAFGLLFEYLVGSKYSIFLRSVAGVSSLFFLSNIPFVCQVFKRFGKYSLQLYLLNGFFLVFSRSICISVLGINNPFVIVTFNMVVDFLLSYVFIKYICSKIKPVRFIMGMN